MKKLGYCFKNPDLVQMALTHRSVSSQNNERMEFLGDAVLSAVIASYLFKQFPHANEGDLSRLRAKLVNENMLADIAQQLDVGEFMHLGLGERKSGGTQRKSTLADTLEAIIGAIYLDSDFMQCKNSILKWFKPWLEKIASNHNTGNDLKDPKSLLQEYLQAKKIKHKSLPHYELVSMTGDAHAQHFDVSCHVEGYDFVSRGSDSTRRGAEQLAAERFLEWLKRVI